MSNKTFAQAPKPKPLTADIISAFERGGAGQDTQRHIAPNVGSLESPKVKRVEPTRRLSIDLPESLHKQFKMACLKADKSMQDEVTAFIKSRTVELEND